MPRKSAQRGQCGLRFSVSKILCGVITHLKPDILKCEVRWALGNITTNTSSGADGISVELIQILKDDAVKVCTQYDSKFGSFSGPQDWKRSEMFKLDLEKVEEPKLKLPMSVGS